MNRIAYYRVFSTDQSIEEAQRVVMGGDFSMAFTDEGVSGAVAALDRPGFASMMATITAMRDKPELHVYAVDRLGRDSIDVQATVKALKAMGVRVCVHGLGCIEGDTGNLILAIMAQFAEMERNRIRAGADAGREAARKSLIETGKTHHGKESLGRPVEHDAAAIAAWRQEHSASIATTAKQFKVSDSTVKRACAAFTAA